MTSLSVSGTVIAKVVKTIFVTKLLINNLHPEVSAVFCFCFVFCLFVFTFIPIYNRNIVKKRMWPESIYMFFR